MWSWQRFTKSFVNTYVNNDEEYYYYFTRYHFGSYAAFALAGYNLFQIRQKVLKHAIHITKSTNPRVVKAASALVGALYYAGLVVVWHVPSFGAESAVRCYLATENAVTNALISGEQVYQRVMTSQGVDQLLRERGVSSSNKSQSPKKP